MKILLAVVALVLSASASHAMGKWLSEETLKQMQQDIAIVDQPVRIIGPEDDSSAKVERLNECKAHWAHRRNMEPEFPQAGEMLFAVRVWRCMFRANWTMWSARCPTLLDIKKAREAERATVRAPIEEDDDNSGDDEDEDEKQAQRMERQREADERREAEKGVMLKAIKDMQRPYCYALFR